MKTRWLIVICGVLAGCSREDAPAPPASTPSASTVAAPAPAAPPAARKPAPAEAMAYIIAPADGAMVDNPVLVQFGLKGIGVAPAGVDRPDTGHHHLLIDVDLPRLDAPIPSDAQHVHFGGGQTETTITLTPGRHQLRLLLGDNLHVPFDPPIASDPITIEVR
ncbi:MAG TPA: DUF4399 domain-containing protein [Gammaproteobacteria bacterium]|nr:DUF4399 domain-containing protein [Gammaproteobacteria bacterium]